MPIYRIHDHRLIPVKRTTFEDNELKERHHLQPLLKSQIEVIAPDTLIVSEEFSDWKDSRRRIDLLGVDKDANLVVIELKRTEDGGHMELQAIRYAAMASALSFDNVVERYAAYLAKNNSDKDAKGSLLEFLGWGEPNEGPFAEEVRIVLASAEFSKELTTSVLWLNDKGGLDIRCVRMHLYESEGQILVDVQTVIPLPETADYQVQIREKKRNERELAQSTRDVSKYELSVNGKKFGPQYKRGMMLTLVSELLANGVTPPQVTEAISHNKFKVLEGELDSGQAIEQIMKDDTGGRIPRSDRFFCEDGQLFHFDDKTYVLTNQWGTETLDTVQSLADKFPNLKIDCQKAT